MSGQDAIYLVFSLFLVVPGIVLGVIFGCWLLPIWVRNQLITETGRSTGSRKRIAKMIGWWCVILPTILVLTRPELWFNPYLIGLVLFALIGLALVAVDRLEHRLPNQMIIVLTIVVLVCAIGAEIIQPIPGRLTFEAIGVVSYTGLFLLIKLIARTAIGAGDVKFAIPIGLILGGGGPVRMVIGVVAIFLIGGLIALNARGTKNEDGSPKQIAYGPAMFTGTIFAWLP